MARRNEESTETPEEQAPEATAPVPVLYYDASKNPDEGFFAGVPQRDLTQEDLDELPKWLQKSVAAAPFYTTEAPAEVVEDGPGSDLPEIGGSSDAVVAETEAN